MPRFRSAILAAFCVLAGVQPATADLALPTAPLRSYYDDAHARGAESSPALARGLVAVAHGQTLAQRLELLEQASRADPNWASPHLQRSLLWLRRHDLANASLAAREALRCLRTDAVQQSQWLRALVHGAHTLFLAALATMAVLLLARTLFFAQHLVEERARNAPVVLFALAAAVLASAWLAPLAALLVALLALVPFLARGERRALGMLCLALALAEIPVPLLETRAMLLDPASAGARLAQAQFAGSDARLERSLLREIAPGRERDLVLGLLARRRGDLDTAERHYGAAIAADPNWSTPYVNLANVYFSEGDMQRAAAGYRKAQSLAADNAFAAANLAQTYIRMLHFGEADEELARAATLDFDAITHRRAAWLDAQLPVLDMLLGPAEILRLSGDEVRANPRQAGVLLQAWRGSAWSGLSPWKAAAVLLALATLLGSRWRLRAVAYECVSCARLVCTHCTRTPRDSTARVCPYCDLNLPRFERTEAMEPEEAPSRRPRRRPPPRLVDRMPRWLGTLFPGAADLACGAPLAATGTALVAWGAVLAAGAMVGMAAERTQPWFAGANAQALRVAVLIFFLAHLQGLLRLRRSWRRLGQSIPEGR